MRELSTPHPLFLRQPCGQDAEVTPGQHEGSLSQCLSVTLNSPTSAVCLIVEAESVPINPDTTIKNI